MASNPVSPHGPAPYYAGTTAADGTEPQNRGAGADPEGLTTVYYSEGPEAGESAGLLDELLAAFGLAAEQKRIADAGRVSEARSGAWRGLPDAAGSAETFVRERVAVLPVLRELVEQVRALRFGALPSAEHFASVRASVPKRWNAALDAAHAVALHRLCEVCGVPVLERANQLTAGGIGRPVVTCSDDCHKRHKQARDNQKRK